MLLLSTHLYTNQGLLIFVVGLHCVLGIKEAKMRMKEFFILQIHAENFNENYYSTVKPTTSLGYY